MHKCYAMQILKKKIEKTKNKKQNKTKTAKKNGYKEQRDEAQRPCQKVSIKLDATLALELLFILE